jgi:hypothetical protein
MPRPRARAKFRSACQSLPRPVSPTHSARPRYLNTDQPASSHTQEHPDQLAPPSGIPQAKQLLPFYAVFMVLWSLLLCKAWERKEHALAIRWGVANARQVYRAQSREMPLTLACTNLDSPRRPHRFNNPASTNATRTHLDAVRNPLPPLPPLVPLSVGRGPARLHRLASHLARHRRDGAALPAIQEGAQVLRHRARHSSAGAEPPLAVFPAVRAARASASPLHFPRLPYPFQPAPGLPPNLAPDPHPRLRMGQPPPLSHCKLHSLPPFPSHPGCGDGGSDCPPVLGLLLDPIHKLLGESQPSRSRRLPTPPSAAPGHRLKTAVLSPSQASTPCPPAPPPSLSPSSPNPPVARDAAPQPELLHRMGNLARAPQLDCLVQSRTRLEIPHPPKKSSQRGMFTHARRIL